MCDVILSFAVTDFLADVRSLRERYDSSIPTLVHCSAGVGRSGVVVLMDMLMAKVDCGDVRAPWFPYNWRSYHSIQAKFPKTGIIMSHISLSGSGHIQVFSGAEETKDASGSDGWTVQVCI